jgi:large subunit ribosomal protein L21
MTEAVSTPEMVTKKAPKASKKASTKTSRKEGMFAVIATGGKQYRVQVGDTLKIEKLAGNLKEGDSITFDNVLMTDNGSSEITMGNPFINGTSVSATLKKIARYKTVDVIKYKQKSRYFKKYGHRQPYYEVEITGVK